MPTRLVPITAIPEILEKLAEVPSGTAFELAQFEVTTAQLRKDQLQQLARAEDCFDRDYYINLLRKQRPHLEKLHKFETTGWGPLLAQNVIQEAQLSQRIGQTHDPKLVATILEAQGICLPDTVRQEELGGLQ